MPCAAGPTTLPPVIMPVTVSLVELGHVSLHLIRHLGRRLASDFQCGQQIGPDGVFEELLPRAMRGEGVPPRVSSARSDNGTRCSHPPFMRALRGRCAVSRRCLIRASALPPIAALKDASLNVRVVPIVLQNSVRGDWRATLESEWAGV
jgi:hypothetical protein